MPMDRAPVTLETLAVRMAAVEQAIQKNSEDHGKIYARLEHGEQGQAVIQTNLANITTVCNEIKADVKDIKDKPAQRYDGLVNAVLQWAVIALLSAKSFLG